MRAAGETYLPKHENESPKNYVNRLAMSVLKNGTDQTLNSWVGRPFSDPVELSDDLPEPIKLLMEDVDTQGNNVQVFAREWLKDGLAKAFSAVLVEFPVVEKEGRTLADDRADNLRPYWCHIKPESIISASATTEKGREVWTHVRIKECEMVRDGFGEREIHRIRVFDRSEAILDVPAKVYVTIWEYKEAVGKKKEWTIVQQATQIDSDEIPLVVFYEDREGLLQGKSAIEGLADLNIKHWQSRSDQDNILTVTRFPMLAQSGASPDGADEGQIKIGPRRLLATTDPQGKFYYVEHSGAAISAGRDDLKDIEADMADYGADFLQKRPGNETATARAIDSAEATSPLQDAVIRFNDALARAISLTCKWMKIEPAGSVKVAVDFGPEIADPSDFAALASARQGHDISRKTYLAELVRRGTLGDDFDEAKNDQQLTKEKDEFGGEPVSGPIDFAQ